MATVDLYSMTVAVYIRQLKNTLGVMDKTVQYLKDNERPHEYVLNARLFPDMKPLAYQINVMTNVCYSGTPRKDWLWVDNFAKPTDPKTFEGCADRIRKTLEFLEALKPEDVIDMPIAFWPTGKENVGPHFAFESGVKYVTQFALPNFWFHATTAYDLMRHCGAPIGKSDFMAAGGKFDTGK